MYWLDLLFDSQYIDEDMYISLSTASKEIVRILVSSVKTAK